jgi:hypothetical protein
MGMRDALLKEKGKYEYLLVDGLSDLDALSVLGGTYDYMSTPIGKSFNKDPKTGEIYKFGESQLDLIKLDVEGSELEALTGGLETIIKQKPHLAIAIYHKPNDHWEIPLFVNRQFPFYEFLSSIIFKFT